MPFLLTPNQLSRGDTTGLLAFTTDGDFSVHGGNTLLFYRTPELVTSLPAASRRWLGKTAILRSSGVQDTVNICVLDSNGTTYTWRQIS